MKKIILHFIIFFVITILAYGLAFAVKPGESVNPNGFPSGTHYNLNIHGKNDGFNCPEQKYYMRVTYNGSGEHNVGDLVEECDVSDSCEATDIPIYGNSIFVPENGQGIEIYMQSGKVGGKGKKASSLPQTELWAVDPCADGDGAVIQLPPGEYGVYARALAKPTDNPDISVTPDLIAAVEDEFGNDLVFLGLLTDNGFVTPTQQFTRSKGKSKAITITGLFEWTGDVCYFDDLGDASAFDYTKTLCCDDYEQDGIWDICCNDSNGDFSYTIDECIGDTSNFTGACSELTTYCNSYTEEWVFNIGDFVNYLWKADNNGVKLLQVRFYPR